jgi:lysyl-tRNA synthetase class II
MNLEMMEALEALAVDRGISVDLLFAALADALESSYKRTPGAHEFSWVTIDPDTMDIRVLAQDLDEEGEPVGEEFDVTPDERRKRALALGAEIGPDYVDYEVTNGLFEKLIEPTLIQPTFVTHLPKELIPLAKLTPDDPTTIEVFECCINGQEIAPAYTEQNDPVAQREALQNQAGGEQQKLDEDSSSRSSTACRQRAASASASIG